MLNVYRVGTFYHGTHKSHIAAYVRDYHSAWKGCVVYQVTASSGAEAKRIAIDRRWAAECAKESE